MHSERLLDHFQNPRNPGELAPPALKVDVTNPACGDMLRLSARIEAGRIAEARFLSDHCGISQRTLRLKLSQINVFFWG